MTTFLCGLGVLLLTLPALSVVVMIAMTIAALVWFLVLMNIGIVGVLVSCVSREKGEAMILWANKEFSK